MNCETKTCFLVFLCCQPRHAVKLLSVLKYMAHRYGPDSFFSFPGKNAAVSTLSSMQPEDTLDKCDVCYCSD